jgi:hypothetical protein
MKNMLLAWIGVVLLTGFGYHSASAAVIASRYNSTARAHTNFDNNTSANDPVSSSSSAGWPNSSSGFLQSSAEASGLNLTGSSARFASVAPIANAIIATESSFSVPVEVKVAGSGNLRFSWNGQLDVFSERSGNASYNIFSNTANNPGDFSGSFPGTSLTGNNAERVRENDSITQLFPQNSLSFDGYKSIFWHFDTNDVGKIFTVNFTAQTRVDYNDLTATILGDEAPAGTLLGRSSIAANLLFGENGVLAPVVTAVPIPAAIWLFGSALLGLFGFNKRKISL